MSVTAQSVRARAEADARTYGYRLSPDTSFLDDLIEGLRTNEERYGYPSCPCRPGTGIFELDRDIVCPCDYRDPDVAQFGTCYCGLYVDVKTFESGKVPSIPERRPAAKMFPDIPATPTQAPQATTAPAQQAHPTEKKLWYCKQCGYTVFREEPPYICPICKAKREFFAEVRLEITQKPG
jgi:ferredoxin-thioredoxin reductase catalytic subunit